MIAICLDFISHLLIHIMRFKYIQQRSHLVKLSTQNILSKIIIKRTESVTKR